MKLSVITINLNNRDGLTKTTESILHQSFSEFEYILVDGASTDGSREILTETEGSSLKSFRWISEPDTGPYEAMNKGIRLASGEYLLFLNSGDFLVNENVLENVFSVIHTADFLLGRCDVSVNDKVIHTITPPPQLTFRYLYYQGLPHQSTFIKRDLFLKHGFYREDFRYNSDIEFWYRTIVLQCCSTETLQTVITNYNKHGISYLDRNTEQYKSEKKEILAHPFLQFFIPDYDGFRNECLEMETFLWARSKPVLNGIITGLYRLARWIIKLRN